MHSCPYLTHMRHVPVPVLSHSTLRTGGHASLASVSVYHWCFTSMHMHGAAAAPQFRLARSKCSFALPKRPCLTGSSMHTTTAASPCCPNPGADALVSTRIGEHQAQQVELQAASNATNCYMHDTASCWGRGCRAAGESIQCSNARGVASLLHSTRPAGTQLPRRHASCLASAQPWHQHTQGWLHGCLCYRWQLQPPETLCIILHAAAHADAKNCEASGLKLGCMTRPKEPLHVCSPALHMCAHREHHKPQQTTATADNLCKTCTWCAHVHLNWCLDPIRISTPADCAMHGACCNAHHCVCGHMCCCTKWCMCRWGQQGKTTSTAGGGGCYSGACNQPTSHA